MSDQQFYEEKDAEEILRLAARDSSAGGMSRERLLQTAAELGITPEAVERAEQQLTKKREADRIQDEEVELRKQYRRDRRRSFINDLSTYIGVNAFMVGVWWFTGGGYFWPGWVIGAWAIGIVSDFFNTFFAKDDEKRFRRWLRRRNRLMGTSDMMARAAPILDEFYGQRPGATTLDAIKELRDRLAVDLRDAKDLVENYESNEQHVVGVRVGSETKD